MSRLRWVKEALVLQLRLLSILQCHHKRLIFFLGLNLLVRVQLRGAYDLQLEGAFVGLGDKAG